MRTSTAVLALLLWAGPASAQSLYGPGGLFLFPTATVPEKGQLTPAVLVLPQYNPDADSTRTWISTTLDYGLTEDVEIGFTALKVAGWDRDPSFGGFIKYRFLRETANRPAMAIGYTDLGFGDVNARAGFLAFRKLIRDDRRFPLVAHLGVQYVDYEDSIPRHEFRPYGGLELGLGRRASFIVEARPRGNAEFGTPLALTATYRVTDDWRLAITWANNGLSESPRFGFGAGLALGSRR